MSMIEEFHTLAGELAVEMMFPAKLVRVGGVYDPRTDTKTRDKQVIACRASVAPRKTLAGNGVVIVQTVANITVEPKAGDQLEIGGRTYTVSDVEEIAPDGRPIMWRGVMK